MYLLNIAHVSIIFLTLITGVYPAAAPQPTPPPSALNTRSQCNEDNCLRALRNHISSASSFCDTYTTAIQTATAGFPTYIPTTCGPTRVSSACSCAVTKGPCATNAPTQVVQLPGFETNLSGPIRQTDNYDGAWNSTDTAARSFFIDDVAYEGSYAFKTWGFDDYGDGKGVVGINGVATLYQTLALCPSSKYQFSFFVSYDGNDGYGFNTTVTAYLDDTVIVPTQLTCVDASQCNLKATAQLPGFRQVMAPDLITPPPSGMAKLRLVLVRASTAPGDPPIMDTYVDLVTMTKVS